MPKRVLGNIANFNSVRNLGVKRVAETSPKPLCKKSKNQTLEPTTENDCRNRNKENIKNDCDTTTRTLELRVKNIRIAGECQNDVLEKPKCMVNQQPQSTISLECDIDFSNPISYYQKPSDIPEDVEDFDKNQIADVFSEPQYARDVFNYYKRKEVELRCTKYLHNQPEISKSMRAVLIDWLVEVQESFELNHETLYLAVKVIDHYLTREKIPKAKFQLLGATAILIAAKYDERIPPSIEDFLYICDNAYSRQDVIVQEIDILKKLDFCLGYPLSYRFLRRYARCSKLSMETLTLARYILEMSLMEYDFIEFEDSLISAAALLLALKMKQPHEQCWSKSLKYYSGYDESHLITLMYKLNDFISTPKLNLKTIRNKYSHKIFFEVAKINPLPKRKV
ncbi:G2/mitotic-specific cyclin-B3-like protein [Leptotrombidium deliense]|uniref:G2/mitotic-specific cyclin-B3-like protein n=1 Tax=Leptotrombidium deliense TaxID=299467 RepID=A0A443SLN5_9ACAR|nr:G2/mitotic-specific cyclin-B3-like protein [Leptotrombidium deliense]